MKKNILTKSVFVALLLASSVVAAEEYPAADFQPTVVYSDAGNSSTSSEPAVKSEATATVEKAESSNNLLFGLVIAAIAGGFFLSNKPKAGAKSGSDSSSHYGEAGGLTGVEKYLQAQNASAVSATGVEKYLAKKEAAEKEASVTGVDRYLRKHG